MEKGKIIEGLTVASLYRFSEHSLAYPLLQRYLYPWEALSQISDYIEKVGEELPWATYRSMGGGIWIAEGATVASTAQIKGPCIIGPRAEIRHGAFIRGSVLIGADCVIGNSTELKNCILFDGVQVPHYNYVGDSILGYRVHLGAGAVTSNIKSDKTLVFLRIKGSRFPTGRRKIGAMIGDFSEIGCNTVLNPGTVIGRECTVYPLSSVRGYIPDAHIYKSAEQIVEKRILES